MTGLSNNNYRMPAEWAAHERCWMAWPCRTNGDLWSDIEATRRAYAAVAHAIRDFEPVTMVVSPALVSSARDCLGADIDILELPIDDSWARDSGPNFVLEERGGLAGVAFRFNAWGEKYAPYDQDALMAERILDSIGVPCIQSELVAEGGGLCVDGEGTLLTTDTCFPNTNRNPGWSRDDIEAELKTRLGVEEVLWLPGDPLDDETDGHVDGLASFARPGTIILQTTAADDESYMAFYDTLRRSVEQATDARGRSFELVALPEANISVASNDRYCLSYVNFYYANGAIIAPAYDITTDDEVRERLQSCFPEREIAMVPIADIAEGGGGIHCITQQQPYTE